MSKQFKLLVMNQNCNRQFIIVNNVMTNVNVTRQGHSSNNKILNTSSEIIITEPDFYVKYVLMFASQEVDGALVEGLLILSIIISILN